MTFRHVTEIDLKTQKQRPIRHNFLQTLRCNFHWKCLLCTLLIHSCILYAIWCHLNYYGFYFFVKLSVTLSSYADVGRVCARGYSVVSLAFGLLLYVVYLTECWNYRRKLFAVPRRSSAQIYALAQQMRDAIPIVWWKSVCYHYLRRTRQVTRYRNGDAISATQVYYERVNSHSSGNVFHYDTCGYKDITKELSELESYPLIRMRFTKGFVFACVQAADEFEEQRMRFFNENEVRDDYMEVREGLDLASVPFIEQALVYASQPIYSTDSVHDVEITDGLTMESEWAQPWYMRMIAFWSASILLLSWPLRMMIECRTAHLTFQVTKLFGTNYLSPSSFNYTGPLTRTSTMESRELELANRENYIIIPSYSEAILLDPLNNSVVPNNTLTQDNARTRYEPYLASNEALCYANYDGVPSRPLERCTALERGASQNAPHHHYEEIAGANLPPQHVHCYQRPTRSDYEEIGEDVNYSNYSPYRQKMQRFFNNINRTRRREGGNECSPYRRFDEARGQRRFPLSSFTPRQLRSKSMSFFNEALFSAEDASKWLNETSQLQPAVPIPRPSLLRVQTRSSAQRSKLNRIPNGTKTASRKKAPPRSITYAEGMSLNLNSSNLSYEYSTSIHPSQALINSCRSRGLSGGVPERNWQYDGADSVVVERGTRRILTSRQNYGSPFRRQNALAIGANEPPPPYEVALRMCAPIYERLRRSTASITSLFNSANNNNANNDNLCNIHYNNNNNNNYGGINSNYNDDTIVISNYRNDNIADDNNNNNNC